MKVHSLSLKNISWRGGVLPAALAASLGFVLARWGQPPHPHEIYRQEARVLLSSTCAKAASRVIEDRSSLEASATGSNENSLNMLQANCRVELDQDITGVQGKSLLHHIISIACKEAIKRHLRQNPRYPASDSSTFYRSKDKSPPTAPSCNVGLTPR